ncbi:c-type cytochrome [Roseobacteraceae bacterium NS-SX3]
MRRQLRFLPALALMVLLLAAAAGSGLTASERSTNKHVKARIELMATQKAAMEVLEGMMAGRTPFDAAAAKAARRTLTGTTKSIRKHFRKPHMDASSNARPEIWAQWDGFTARADAAKAAARNLNARSPRGLRRTLPNLLRACLGCHQAYRNVPKEFITH